MDEIKKYDGSVCKEGYYRFQTRNWFDLDRMRTADNAEQCFALWRSCVPAENMC